MFVAFVVFVLLAGACTSGGGSSSSVGGVSGLPQAMVNFGSLQNVPLVLDSPTYKGPSTPHSLDGVGMSDPIRSMLRDPKVAKKLASLGFVVVPSDLQQFYSAYTSECYDGTTVYVTTDVAYHEWHLVFDKVLRSLEQEVLLPKLEQLAGRSLANAQEQSKQLAGSSLASDASRIEQLMQVEAALLELPAGELGPLAKSELALVQQHSQVAKSPVTGALTDYSLYTPRGHYTRTQELTRFFLGMSLLGQASFLVRDPAQLRLGVLASRLMVPRGLGNQQAEQPWKDIYEPTAFLVGTADDYTPVELADAVNSITPGAMSDPTKLTDADVEKIGQALLDSRPVRIDPEKASVRLMGVRFVADSFVLDQLIWPNVGTETDKRLIPSAMDLVAAFGSDLAYKIQKGADQTKYAHYDEQLKLMQTMIADRPQKDWGATVYDSWLWSLEPAWSPHGKAFPDYMRTPEWTAKDHQTGLGSYAELKHDTILFAKQAVAEGGGCPKPTFVPRNWVEPDPAAYQRLAAMATLMRKGLAERGLLARDADKLLSDLIDMYGFFARIAEDELAGKPISAADNDSLTDMGGTLEGLWWRTADRGPQGVSEADDDAAIMADIARGGDEVVEVGTGRIDEILVIVPDDHGGFQVALGGVYSYYEFLQPVSNRLTDEAWRQMLDRGKAPARPTWEQVFLAL